MAEDVAVPVHDAAQAASGKNSAALSESPRHASEMISRTPARPRSLRCLRNELTGGDAPPAAVFFYSPDRASIHPEQHLAGYSGILQADAYAGFKTLYEPDRKPGPITEAGCWAHARRKLFELADIASKARNRKPTTISPIAFEAVQKFDAIFVSIR